jgi:hypothetical protein
VAAIAWDKVTAWRLMRGHLSRRVGKNRMVDAVSDMCGAHAQILSTVSLALAARTSGATTAHVSTALDEDRTLVKTWSMRGTLHVLTAEDLPLYCAALRASSSYAEPSYLDYLGLEMADADAVLEAIPVALDGQILTREELADAVVKITRKKHLDEHLRSGWGSLLKPAAFRGLLCFGPQSGRSVTFVRPDQWIGGWKDLHPEDALREVFRRFLSAYGPASKTELGRWWGVTPAEMGPVLDLMRHELDEIDVGNRKRYMLKSDIRSLKAVRRAKGVRFLPSFDQLLVMSAPHSEAVVDAGFKERVYRQRVAVWSLPAVMVDGRLRASWRLDRKKRSAVVTVDPFGPVPRGSRSALEEEVARLGTFLNTDLVLELVEA